MGDPLKAVYLGVREVRSGMDKVQLLLSHYAESRYTRQLNKGFGWLHFEPELETEYRLSNYRAFRTTRIGALCTLLLALLFFLGFDIFYALRHYDATLTPAIFGMRLIALAGIMLSASMVLYGNDRSAGAFWVPCTVFFIGTTTLVSNILYMQVLEQVGMPFNLDGMILVLIAIFFPVGYSYWGSVVCAVVTFIVMLVAIPVFLPEGYLDDFIALSIYPLVAMFFAGMSRYFQESATRRQFLTRAALKELADSDSLTGLFNRRMFEILLERALLESQRERHCLGLMLVDVDYFKSYNDRYGHPMGDAALQAVAETLGALPRRSLDIAARLGGEEFALVFCDLVPDFATRTAERVRQRVEALGIPHEGSQVSGVLTVSIGVALSEPGDTRASLYKRADEALYRSKGEGRNRVTVAD